MKPLDIAIAGCGPAGLAAAVALTRIGHKVQLFDQFDEPRPLGSGLMMQPAGLDALDWLDLGERLRQLGAPIGRLFGREIHSGRIVLDVRYEALRNGRTVHRAALFNVLFDAVKAFAVPIETGAKIVSLDRAAGRRPLLVADKGRRFGPFDLVIDALGSRSPLIEEAAAPVKRCGLAYGALWTTLPWIEGAFDERTLEQRYERASVMIGVLPAGRRFPADNRQTTFFWSLKSADYPRWKEQGLTAWRERVTQLWPATEPLIAQISDPGQMILAGYGHHTLPLPFGDRIVFLGDSAHSTSPQLGQGANMALLDVRALVQVLEGAMELDQALALYARLRRTHVRLYQAMSAVFTPFYQSDSTLLPDAAGLSGGTHEPDTPGGAPACQNRRGRPLPAAKIVSLLSRLDDYSHAVSQVFIPVETPPRGMRPMHRTPLPLGHRCLLCAPDLRAFGRKRSRPVLISPAREVSCAFIMTGMPMLI